MDSFTITNLAIHDAREFDSEGCHFTESWRQAYAENNCVFAGGQIEGHPHDTIYLLIEKDGMTTDVFTLRPDEATAICMALMGAVWAQQYNSLPDEDEAVVANEPTPKTPHATKITRKAT
jgi:hypothetical protein